MIANVKKINNNNSNNNNNNKNNNNNNNSNFRTVVSNSDWSLARDRIR